MAPRPVLGYAMVLAASILFGFNGAVSKVILASGISSLRLTEVRCTGALLTLGLFMLLRNPRSLRATPRDLLFLLFFGIAGVALVQWFYFLAIHRLPVGIALLIQYVGPLLVAVWSRFVYKRPLRRRVWVALGLALAGLALVVEIWSGLALNGAGVAAALAAAATYAIYLLSAEHGVALRDPRSLAVWGFVVSSVFFAALTPWWTFPGHLATEDVSLLGRLDSVQLPVWSLMIWMVVLGTVVPFLLVFGALRHLSATRVGLTAMVEPVVATVVAWIWLGEAFGAWQIGGGLAVLAAIGLAQTR